MSFLYTSGLCIKTPQREEGKTVRMKTVIPAISIIIPVYREADRINQLVTYLREIDRIESCEIIIVDGHPAKTTLAALHHVDADVVALGSEKGRARQMNAGASRASADTLLFLHADTYLPDSAVDDVLCAMKDSRVSAGSFGFSFDSHRRVLRWLGAIVSLRARLTRLPLGDHAIFIRREEFLRMGKYREIPLMEDLDLMRRIKRTGGRVRILGSKVKTSPRRFEQEGLWYCTIRNLVLVGLFSLGARPGRLKRFYPDAAPTAHMPEGE